MIFLPLNKERILRFLNLIKGPDKSGQRISALRKLFPDRISQNIISKLLNPWANLPLYLSLNFALLAYYLLSWPIEARDTDLWYHLNAGRYFFTQGEISHTTFFSFLLPAREYLDYYWLFQVLVYKIYTWGDYYGLIILKTALFLATMFSVFLFLFQKQCEKKASFYLAIIFTLYILLFAFRLSEIRPYVFGYFFIALFLYLFEVNTPKLFLLPLVAVFWCNIHGIEYPIILIITFSYLTEFLLGLYRRKERLQSRQLRYLVPILLTIAAIYATPHGARLLGIPFTSTQFTSEYINELRTLHLGDLFIFQLSSSGLFWQTIFNLLILLAGTSLYLSFRRHQVRISHLLLAAGGIVLLFKGVRFYYEFALLLLPLFRSNPIIIPAMNAQGKMKKSWAIFLILILLAPIIVLANYYMNPPRYPFSTSRLPQGIVTFLTKVPAAGKLMNHPNWGGYLQWTLYPRYRIFMDMQVPFVFKDEDLHAAVFTYSNAEVFSKVMAQYEPTFVMAYLLNKEIRQNIKKYPRYKLVFFDHMAALYLHEGHYPAIAREYEIKNIDPFEVAGKNIDKMINAENREGFLEDLSKILKIYPECFLGNQLLALINLHNNEFTKALVHAEVIIKNFPENPTGYLLKGDTLKGLKSYETAIWNYQQALGRTEAAGERAILKKIGYTYGAQQEYKQAYRFMRKGISVFSSQTTFQELWDLSSAALLSGKLDEAYSLLQFASQKVPAADEESQRRIQDQLARFGQR